MADEVHPLDVGDAASVKAVRKDAKLEAEQDIEVLRTVMSIEPGRRWMHKLLVKCHCFANPFSKDPLVTAFSCGEMNIGQQILIELNNHCTDTYLQMMKENRE